MLSLDKSIDNLRKIIGSKKFKKIFVLSGKNSFFLSGADKIIKNMNINPKTFFLRAASQSIKNLLKKETSEAFEKGIFGAPTFYINKKIFWGQDRLSFAIDEASK